jgi:hypothetical protein
MQTFGLYLLSSLEELPEQICTTVPELICAVRRALVLIANIEVRIMGPYPSAGV